MTEASGEQSLAANTFVGGLEEQGTKSLGENGVSFIIPFL